MIILMANNEKEMKEMKEMEKEMKRLKNITDQLWKEGKATKWETMTHTNKGVANHEYSERFNSVHKFMTKKTDYSNSRKSKTQLKSMNFINRPNNSSMQFGLRKKVSYAGLFL